MPQNQRPIINNHYHQAREKTAKEKEIEDYKYKKTMKAKAKEERAETAGIIKFIIMIMLCITLFRVVSTPADQKIIPVTFGEIVEVVRNVPQIATEFNIFNDLTIKGSWGIVDGLREFINTLMSAISAIVYIFGGIVQMILYAVYFVGFALGI